MDFSAPVGTPVYATGDARVQSAGWHSGYGNLIELDHGYHYLTRYAHLSEILVRPGQTVGAPTPTTKCDSTAWHRIPCTTIITTSRRSSTTR